MKTARFTYRVCGSFTKNKERIKKFKETGDSKYIYQNKLYKACFQYDMAYGDFKDLNRRTATDKVSRDKAFNFAKNTSNVVLHFFIIFVMKKLLVEQLKIKSFLIKNYLKSYTQIIKKIEKEKVHSSFMDNFGAQI